MKYVLHITAILPGDLEEAKQSYAAEHRDAHCWHKAHVDKSELHYASGHHKAVKAIEERHEVRGQAKCIHLHEHFSGKHRKQHFVGVVWLRQMVLVNRVPAEPGRKQTWKKRDIEIILSYLRFSYFSYLHPLQLLNGMMW